MGNSLCGIKFNVNDYNFADMLLFSLLRFEIEIEPIFASLALYDIKEKKKVSCYDSLCNVKS